MVAIECTRQWNCVSSFILKIFSKMGLREVNPSKPIRNLNLHKVLIS